MKELFVPYEQAIILKELGFDEECFCWYDLHELVYYKTSNSKLNKHYVRCSAPLYQQAFRWFREKYGYFPSFDFQHGDSKDNKGYFFCIININNEDFFFPEDFENEVYKTYKEAELECIKKLIELLKNK